MFVDLDWPLNASSLLSASAELLVGFLLCGIDALANFVTAPLWQPVALSSLCYFCCLLLVFRRISSEILHCFVRCGRLLRSVQLFRHFVLRFSVFVVELFGSGSYGDRAFPVAAVRIWNSLPQHVTSAPSVCLQASAEDILHSLEDILLRTVLFIKLLSCLRSDIVILDTLIVLLTYLLTYLL